MSFIFEARGTGIGELGDMEHDIGSHKLGKVNILTRGSIVQDYIWHEGQTGARFVGRISSF